MHHHAGVNRSAAPTVGLHAHLTVHEERFAFTSVAAITGSFFREDGSGDVFRAGDVVVIAEPPDLDVTRAETAGQATQGDAGLGELFRVRGEGVDVRWAAGSWKGKREKSGPGSGKGGGLRPFWG